MKPELKPCPWCGKKDLVVFKGTPVSHDSIKCHTCNLYVPLTVAEWNRRSAPSAEEVPAEVQQVIDALGRQEQCDQDGIYCQVSRQAVDEAIEIIKGRYALSALPGKETSK